MINALTVFVERELAKRGKPGTCSLEYVGPLSPARAKITYTTPNKTVDMTTTVAGTPLPELTVLVSNFIESQLNLGTP